MFCLIVPVHGAGVPVHVTVVLPTPHAGFYRVTKIMLSVPVLHVAHFVPAELHEAGGEEKLETQSHAPPDEMRLWLADHVPGHDHLYSLLGASRRGGLHHPSETRQLMRGLA